MFVINNLSKSFSQREFALKNIGFSIEPQSFTAILGSSGAGKTTLLRCILQIQSPDQGTVLFNQHNLTQCSKQELRWARSQIGFIAQDYNLVGRRSALENCLAGRLQELPFWRCLLNQYPRPLLLEAMTALARVGLADLAFRRADRLSGGQQQRVAIARALTQRVELLLADEPIASLDPESAHTVLSLLKSLCHNEGLTVVCNLHQVEFAKQYSDRILGMRHGEVVLDQPTAQVTNKALAQLYRG